MQGVITTDDAQLNAGVEVAFVVTNTLVELTDTVVLAIQSGGTVGEYMAQVVTVTNGTFTIALANLSGSNASDAVIINFYVLRGDR
jgi:glucosamine 6-phosphate synthetase-like amidotransferase/phosphosugar isomerase protein|tara:strand:+ start:416 stop:673 length:258 start_codon:yes stop_codon:yes gene_type:complete